MTTLRKYPFEPLLFAVAFLAALAIRLVRVDAPPLTDFEASQALQALAIVKGGTGATAGGTLPIYLNLTTLWFFIFQVSDFTARFWPAVAGSTVVLLPILLRRQLGSVPALVLAFGLALDPGLAAVARQIASPGFAAVLLWLGLACFALEQYSLAGFLAGLFLLSGESAWLGVLGIALALFVAGRLAPRGRRWWLLNSFGLTDPQAEAGAPVESRPQVQPGVPWKRLGLTALITFIAAGSLVFASPRGLSAFGASLAGFFNGWAHPSGAAVLFPLTALAVYEPFVLIFGILGGTRATVRAFRSGFTWEGFLVLAAAILLVVTLVYPGRQTADLVWVIIPLWFLAAREIAGWFSSRQWIPIVSQMVMVFVMLVLAWLQLAGLAGDSAELYTQHLAVIAAALALLVASMLLIGWGWGLEVIKRGFIGGLASFLALYSMVALTYSAGLRPAPTAELWQRDAAIGEGRMLEKTLSQLSEWETGFHSLLDGVVVGFESPALQWLLRDQPQITSAAQVKSGIQPLIVITKLSDQPELAAGYRGQDFSWYQAPNWNQAAVEAPMRWLVYHIAPLQTEKIIMWVRADVLPGDSSTSIPTIPQSVP
jgi:hypothetical protein